MITALGAALLQATLFIAGVFLTGGYPASWNLIYCAASAAYWIPFVFFVVSVAADQAKEQDIALPAKQRVAN